MLTPALAAVWQSRTRPWWSAAPPGCETAGAPAAGLPASATRDRGAGAGHRRCRRRLPPGPALGRRRSGQRRRSVRHGTWETTQLGGPAAAQAEMTTGRHYDCRGRMNRWADTWDRGGADQVPAKEQGARPGGGWWLRADWMASCRPGRLARTGEDDRGPRQLSAHPVRPASTTKHARLLSWLTNLADTAMPLAGLMLAVAAGTTLLVPPRLRLPDRP